MKRRLVLILLMISVIMISASEYDDLLFAAGLYSDGNLSLAKTELERYLSQQPESKYASEAEYLLGSIYLEEESFERSVNIFSKLLANPPASIELSDLIINLAASYRGVEAYDKAIPLLEELKVKEPNTQRRGEILYLLGSCYYHKGRAEAAEKTLKEALLVNNSPAVYQELINVQLEKGDLVSARELVNDVLDAYPGDERTAYALLRYQQKNIDSKNFQEFFEIGYKSIDQNSAYYEQYSLLAGIAAFETGKYELSKEHLEDLQAPEAHYYKALSYIKLDMTDKAKTILEAVYRTQEGKLKANSLFYLAGIEDDPAEKMELFNEFISNNADNPFIADAYFQSGITAFELKEQTKAETNLKKAIELGIDPKSREEAEFLLIEISYLLKAYDEVIAKTGEFAKHYSQSTYMAEAYFKKALSYYHLKQYNKAEENFKLITYNFQSSSKTGISNFYIAEVNLLQGKTGSARKFYSAAIEGNADKELCWLRIAQSWFKDDEQAKAQGALNNIADDSAYAKEKLLLEGDIAFSQKEYTKSIELYNLLVNMEDDKQKKESIIARKAWAYYQLGDYAQASNIYKQLSIRTDKPAGYTFQSATALFSAQLYELALEQYQVFVENFPEHENYMAAEVGIADCYYNLQNYDEARKQYRRLLTIITKEDLYNSALDGWKWATEQSGKSFLEEINDFLSGEVQYNFYFLVSRYKAYYLFSEGMYDKFLLIVDELLKRYSYPMKDLEFMKADALKKSEKWDEAEDRYAHLFMNYHDPELQYEWAEISIHKGEIQTAVRKLQYASENTNNPEYILKLLELEQQHGFQDFANDYRKYSIVLTDVNREKADILQVKWLIDHKNYQEADQLIAKLKNSQFKETQAQAQYLKGYVLYSQGLFDASVPELLRVRHLFPYLLDVRQQAEELAFRAYLKAGKTTEAENLLDNIKSEISSEKSAELNQLLEEAK